MLYGAYYTSALSFSASFARFVRNSATTDTTPEILWSIIGARPYQQGGPGGAWPTQLSGQVFLFVCLFVCFFPATPRRLEWLHTSIFHIAVYYIIPMQFLIWNTQVLIITSVPQIRVDIRLLLYLIGSQRPPEAFSQHLILKRNSWGMHPQTPAYSWPTQYLLQWFGPVEWTLWPWVGPCMLPRNPNTAPLRGAHHRDVRAVYYDESRAMSWTVYYDKSHVTKAVCVCVKLTFRKKYMNTAMVVRNLSWEWRKISATWGMSYWLYSAVKAVEICIISPTDAEALSLARVRSRYRSLAWGSSVCWKKGIVIVRVCALVFVTLNLQLDVMRTIDTNLSDWYERVPLVVLLYVSITSSSHVSWLLSLTSSRPIAILVRFKMSKTKDVVVWLLKKCVFCAPKRARLHFSASDLQEPGSPNRNGTPMQPHFLSTSLYVAAMMLQAIDATVGRKFSGMKDRIASSKSRNASPWSSGVVISHASDSLMSRLEEVAWGLSSHTTGEISLVRYVPLALTVTLGEKTQVERPSGVVLIPIIRAAHSFLWLAPRTAVVSSMKNRFTSVSLAIRNRAPPGKMLLI